MPDFKWIGSGVSEPQVAENDHLPLTWHIALTTAYTLTCYTVMIAEEETEAKTTQLLLCFFRMTAENVRICPNLTSLTALFKGCDVPTRVPRHTATILAGCFSCRQQWLMQCELNPGLLGALQVVRTTAGPHCWERQKKISTAAAEWFSRFCLAMAWPCGPRQVSKGYAVNVPLPFCGYNTFYMVSLKLLIQRRLHHILSTELYPLVNDIQLLADVAQRVNSTLVLAFSASSQITLNVSLSTTWNTW